MASMHNLVLRGLNAIYLQAPHVQPADETSFCAFIGNWHSIITLHHMAEEEDGFPLIEEMAGEKGIMDESVDQHHAFLGGLDGLGKYAAECAAGREKYDGKRVVEMIDGFGPELAGHLEDEIPTIEGLRRYGVEKMAGLKGVLEAEAERNKVSCTYMIEFIEGRLPDIKCRADPVWPVYASSLCRTTSITRAASGQTGRRCRALSSSCVATY